MNSAWTKIKRLVKQALGHIPTKLPVGMAAFDAWVDDLIQTYTMPTEDRDSVVNCIAATIMRLDPTTYRKSKSYFAAIVTAGAAKQIAGAQFAQIRDRQKAAELAAKNSPVPSESL